MQRVQQRGQAVQRVQQRAAASGGVGPGGVRPCSESGPGVQGRAAARVQAPRYNREFSPVHGALGYSALLCPREKSADGAPMHPKVDRDFGQMVALENGCMDTGHPAPGQSIGFSE